MTLNKWTKVHGTINTRAGMGDLLILMGIFIMVLFS